ncbi:MAG: L-seryl-tRNA(Sec) selenium transferase [Sedimentisphaerales bacterium]|jgi:L-seryl-tRNA(Ser) seleniumtransferase
MTDPKENSLRKIPSIDSLVNDSALNDVLRITPRKIVADLLRDSVATARESIGTRGEKDLDEAAVRQDIIDDVRSRAERLMRPQYRRAINATGIILHTGLGRAVLSQRAIERIRSELSGYSLLQVDIETGKRSRRDRRIEWLIRQLTGAESATIVNNNAAATAIVLNTVAKGREVIVSRGQLVEIGGSFRLPDVMAFSGAKLVEVGTTNRTHAYDYTNAITENTAAIMRIHPSNYKIEGFTLEVPLEEIVEIAHSKGLIMIDDVGSGTMIDFSRFGFAPEPIIIESIQKGADIVTCSGDKLIGASQAGIIAGKTNLIEKIRKNQFMRIVRPGKLTLAALEATLEIFLDEQQALTEIPTIEMLLRDKGRIAKQAQRMVKKIKSSAKHAEVMTIDGFSQMGSGSLPAQDIPTCLIAIKPANMDAETFATRLRSWAMPIFARIEKEVVLIDPRTLRTDDEKEIVEAIVNILSG